MDGWMGITKTEVNLRRLIAAPAPNQHNPSKIYVATLREMLEQLSLETIPQGLPSVSRALLNDYSHKIESIDSKLAAAAPPSTFFTMRRTENPRSNLMGLFSRKAILLRNTTQHTFFPFLRIEEEICEFLQCRR